jgi:hypothetical protein
MDGSKHVKCNAAISMQSRLDSLLPFNLSPFGGIDSIFLMTTKKGGLFTSCAVAGQSHPMH